MQKRIQSHIKSTPKPHSCDPQARYKPGTGQVQARSKPGASQVHARYMRGTCEVHGRYKPGKSPVQVELHAGRDAEAPGGAGGTFLVSAGLRNGYIGMQRFYEVALAGAAYMRGSRVEFSPGRGLGGGRS